MILNFIILFTTITMQRTHGFLCRGTYGSPRTPLPLNRRIFVTFKGLKEVSKEDVEENNMTPKNNTTFDTDKGEPFIPFKGGIKREGGAGDGHEGIKPSCLSIGGARGTSDSPMGTVGSPAFPAGVVMGLPLNILAYIFTTNHYHEPILNAKIILLNCLVGFYTYGSDRMLDAVEYEKNKKYGKSIKTDAKKIQTYEYILENYDILQNIYNASYWIFALLLFMTENDGTRPQTLLFLTLYDAAKFSLNLRYTFFSYYLGIHSYRLFAIYAGILLILLQTHWFDHEFLYLPILMAIDSTKQYIIIKKMIGPLKPVYVAAMWTGAIMVLPGLIHEQNYHILKDSWAPFWIMAGFSNLADIKDTEEDRMNKINTIPVLFGEEMAYFISIMSIITGWFVYKT
jgi:hypothetical protein